MLRSRVLGELYCVYGNIPTRHSRLYTRKDVAHIIRTLVYTASTHGYHNPKIVDFEYDITYQHQHPKMNMDIPFGNSYISSSFLALTRTPAKTETIYT